MVASKKEETSAKEEIGEDLTNSKTYPQPTLLLQLFSSVDFLTTQPPKASQDTLARQEK